jgi:DNA-binding transcriptional MocR family regulator
VPAGSHVVVEGPCFPPLLDLLADCGAAVTAVPLDSEGMRPAQLARALRAPVAAVYLQPCAQNPTGISLTSRRAVELAEVLRESQALIIEDAATASVSTGSSVSMGQWLPDRTVRISGFSKLYGPEIRVAAVGGPTDLVERMAAARQLGQGWTSRILQRLLLMLLTDPVTEEVVRNAREAYAARRAAMTAALAESGIAVGGSAGFNMWVPVVDETAAVMRAARAGVGVAPGAPFWAGVGPRPHVRMTVTGFDLPNVNCVAKVVADIARAAPWIPA